jgi:hypothetical protein
MSTQIRGNKQIKNITIQNEQIANGTIELDKLREGSELIKRDGSVVATGDFDFGSHQIKNLAAPTDDNDAVRKADLEAATSGTLVNREQPTGTLNGSNTTFTLANTPNLGTEQVFLNGALLNSGANSDYVVDGTTLTFTLPPQSGDVILVNYITDGVVVNADVTSTLAQFNSRLTTAEGELFTAQGDITTLTSDVSGINSRLTTAEGDIVAVEGDVATLESTVSAVQGSISSLQSDLSDEEAARIAADDALDTTVGSIQTSVTSIGNRMTTAEGDITALEAADAAFDIRAGVIEDGLQAETNARTSADSALGSRVTALENAPAPVTSYNDLTDKPTLFSGSYNDLTNKPTLFSGSYTDLTNTPSIPADVSDLTDTTGALFSGDYADLSNKPSLFSGSYTDLTNKPTLFSGSYSDLTNKPSIPTPKREIPSGSVNGSNAVFTLSETPSVANTEQVFLNGLLQMAGAEADYTIAGGTITFNTAPDAGWKLVVYYFV